MRVTVAGIAALAALAGPALAFVPLTTKPITTRSGIASRSTLQASVNGKTNGDSDDYDYSDDLVPMWKIEEVDHIFDSCSDGKTMANPLSLKDKIPPSWFVDEDKAVAVKVNVDVHQTCLIDEDAAAPAFRLAGPRREIALDPDLSRAAIVTCGGLCPGLNTVIREVVMCLKRQYGVEHVYGVPEGYRGFKDPSTWRLLDEDVVANYHNMGGSVLGSSRGGHDTKAIVDSLVENNINQLYVIGGDGTLRGAAKISEEVQSRGLQIAIASIPKTIDNDIPIIDRTFGFETAVEAAREAIEVAHVESQGFPLGLGVVKVMGRNSGFIAMHATLGSRVVDLCLVPEIDFYLDGPGGCVDHLADRLLKNGKAVVVVAEGAGQNLIQAEMEEKGEKQTDASGNAKLDDVGPWLTKKLTSKLNEKLEGKTPHGDAVYPKYIDPSYMVRGVPPNTADNVYCTALAHNAVHGAFAGFTSFVVGSVNTRECYVPSRVLVNKRNIIDTQHQSLWQYVVFDTGQPGFQSEDDMDDDEYVTITASGGVVLKLD